MLRYIKIQDIFLPGSFLEGSESLNLSSTFFNNI